MHQPHGHVEDRYAFGGPAFWLSVMGVTVKHSGDRISTERFLEAAAAEEWKDLEGFTFDRLLDWRVVKDGDPPIRAQSRERGLEFQRFAHRFMHCVLMMSSPHGPSARRPKPPANPFTPANPMP